ncbi:hypothetical protein L2E82_42671 [Cichorium intybus]|uniref:Uncharacterized protein n=1 Tax=Cichorium intybus TaxID=13427 RepID=A0ACB8ZMA3_CICIN|nr:hypothetical protein L2E82_42671 [Cichorium intybus]
MCNHAYLKEIVDLWFVIHIIAPYEDKCTRFTIRTVILAEMLKKHMVARLPFSLSPTKHTLLCLRLMDLFYRSPGYFVVLEYTIAKNFVSFAIHSVRGTVSPPRVKDHTWVVQVILHLFVLDGKPLAQCTVRFPS